MIFHLKGKKMFSLFLLSTPYGLLSGSVRVRAINNFVKQVASSELVMVIKRMLRLQQSAAASRHVFCHKITL